jgi:Mg2+-importing ATPase
LFEPAGSESGKPSRSPCAAADARSCTRSIDRQRKSFAEFARLSPDEALQKLSSTAAGLTAGQVEQQLRSVGPNRVARQARHTVLGELVARSINPLNILLLSLATASYFLDDQRAAIMVVLSITLGFLQEYRSNNAADELQKMVSITTSVRRQGDADHVET